MITVQKKTNMQFSHFCLFFYLIGSFILRFAYCSTLLELGASPNYKDARGLTALYLSVIKKTDPKICESLLHDHATLNTQDLQGWQEVHQVKKMNTFPHNISIVYLNFTIIVIGQDVNYSNLVHGSWFFWIFSEYLQYYLHTHLVMDPVYFSYIYVEILVSPSSLSQLKTISYWCLWFPEI